MTIQDKCRTTRLESWSAAPRELPVVFVPGKSWKTGRAHIRDQGWRPGVASSWDWVAVYVNA